MTIKQKKQPDQIELFNALNNSNEIQNKDIARYIHGEILMQVFFIKNNLLSLFKDMQNKKFDLDIFQNNIDLIDEHCKDLRLIMQNIYPSLLESFGLIIAIEGYARDISRDGFFVNIKNDLSVKRLSFSFEKELNIFRTCVLVLNYFEKLSKHKQLIIFINCIDKKFYIEFVSNNAISENDEGTDYYAVPDIQVILAKLLLLKGTLGQNSDWVNFVQIIIPIKTKTIYEKKN